LAAIIKRSKYYTDTIFVALLGIVINAISALALLITAIIMASQTRELRRSATATAFESTYMILQKENARSDRNNIFNLENKSYDKWTKIEKETAERVCCSFDAVGIMCKNNMIPLKL
jgi:hypothetical protein